MGVHFSSEHSDANASLMVCSRLCWRHRIASSRLAIRLASSRCTSRIFDEGLAFCSELKAYDGLGLSQVEAIGPGELFDSAGGTRRWFRIAQGAAEPEPGFDLEAVCRELRLTLEDAVRKWMVADVEVGSFLSGGLDSSIIAALASRAIDRPLKTFSVGLEDSPDIQAAARVAEHIGSDHYQLTFDASDLAAALPHVIYHLESADVDLVRSALSPPISRRRWQGSTSRQCSPAKAPTSFLPATRITTTTRTLRAELAWTRSIAGRLMNHPHWRFASVQSRHIWVASWMGTAFVPRWRSACHVHGSHRATF